MPLACEESEEIGGWASGSHPRAPPSASLRLNVPTPENQSTVKPHVLAFSVTIQTS